MAIRAGQILHDAEGFVIDRIQSAGPGNINIPEEKIYELGNFQTVATVKDIPDLSFDLESFDVSPELEAVLVGVRPDTMADGTLIDLDVAQPLDIISPFKSAQDAFDITAGVALPYLTLERSTYRFGLRQNATQQHTLRGDSIFYIKGTPYYEEFTNTGANTYTFSNTALLYDDAGTNTYALGVHLYDSATGVYKRLFLGEDYTNTSGGITLLSNLSATYNTVAVVYGSATAATYAQTVHETASVKPAAVRPKDIDVYVGTTAATPTFTRWTGVQAVEVTRSVNLENDEEFGNNRFVDQSFDTPEVSGSITIKPSDPEEMLDRIKEITDVSNNIVGALDEALIPVEIRLSDPSTGSVLKTLYIPDCRFTPPSIQGRVQTKLEVQLNFTSDGGQLKIYKGDRP